MSGAINQALTSHGARNTTSGFTRARRKRKMKTIFLLSLVVLGFVIFDWQPAAAQFPKIKIPKVSQPTPQPTPADTTQTSVQPATGKNTQPAQPPGGDRGTTITVGAGPAINKPSVQITLRTHQQYYRGAERDQETWSWTPRIA